MSAAGPIPSISLISFVRRLIEFEYADWLQYVIGCCMGSPLRRSLTIGPFSAAQWSMRDSTGVILLLWHRGKQTTPPSASTARAGMVFLVQWPAQCLRDFSSRIRQGYATCIVALQPASFGSERHGSVGGTINRRIVRHGIKSPSVAS